MWLAMGLRLGAARNIVSLGIAGAATLVAGAAPAGAAQTCDRIVSSVSGAQTAVSQVGGGKVVCMADGSYGGLTLSASRSSTVTLRSERPGRATIDGASLSGRNLSLSRFKVTDDIAIQPGSQAISVEYNRITGGYMGIDAGPTTSTYISDTTIRGNQFVGPFGEDALRLNRYHDGPDANRYGILIVGNEFTNIRENGNHSDCLQSVWGGDHLYFVRNYLHDNRCQGFFIKDQPAPIDVIRLADNLFVRNNAPCDPGFPGCGQPIAVPIGGPIRGLQVSENTIIGDLGFGGTGLVNGTIDHNVVTQMFSGTDISAFSEHHNMTCDRWTINGGRLPERPQANTRDCTPPFVNPQADDYRITPRNGTGISWRPAAQHYGP